MLVALIFTMLGLKMEKGLTRILIMVKHITDQVIMMLQLKEQVHRDMMKTMKVSTVELRAAEAVSSKGCWATMDRICRCHLAWTATLLHANQRLLGSWSLRADLMI